MPSWVCINTNMHITICLFFCILYKHTTTLPVPFLVFSLCFCESASSVFRFRFVHTAFSPTYSPCSACPFVLRDSTIAPQLTRGPACCPHQCSAAILRTQTHITICFLLPFSSFSNNQHAARLLSRSLWCCVCVILLLCSIFASHFYQTPLPNPHIILHVHLCSSIQQQLHNWHVTSPCCPHQSGVAFLSAHQHKCTHLFVSL